MLISFLIVSLNTIYNSIGKNRHKINGITSKTLSAGGTPYANSQGLLNEDMRPMKNIRTRNESSHPVHLFDAVSPDRLSGFNVYFLLIKYAEGQ